MIGGILAMISKKRQYLLIGLFFVVLTILTAISFFQSGFEKSNAIYAVICAFLAVIFLKNAFSNQ